MPTKIRKVYMFNLLYMSIRHILKYAFKERGENGTKKHDTKIREPKGEA